MTEKNTAPATKPAATLDDLRALTRQIEALETARNALAREVPPVRYSELCSDGCNIKDSKFESDVRRFIERRMTSIDTSLLDRDDLDKWECLTPRYEVREFETTGTDDDNEDVRYGIFDRAENSFVGVRGDDAPRAFDDEFDARDHASELESEARYGFPFAHTYGSLIENEAWIDDLRASGFEVYRYDGDQIIAGIDGGGYSFMGAHFAPFYARLAAKNDWLVETQDGPRRIVMD